ncbi:hypothetical protein EJ04DRAFT_494500 [Polyplosphaeria fusca]|uniref:Amino acid transporter n=1 Tax=Polyplosphaeria fusca TaxID=682080 RepID=A0A9P4V239_9PLEO|nr:hypothetical protein EJ04DRAFT_494500 [Polyplosphaeria fusca]
MKSAIVLNKMFGTGIFVTPTVVLTIVNSKGVAILLWLAGGLLTWAGLAMYLEYGIRFPLTGGELHYIDHVWSKPPLLFPYMYSFIFVVLSGSQANALSFGKAVIIANTSEGAPIDSRLQKTFSIAIIGIVCLLQAYSRINYVRFNNLFAVYKILLLSFLTVTGWCALGGKRSTSAAAMGKPYGLDNLRDNGFADAERQPYGFALALLSIMRVFLGYENANFVLEEVQRPPGDESRIYRRASKFTVLGVTFFYLMVNIAFFASSTTEDLQKTSDALGLFFKNVFGPSYETRKASGIIQAISASGNIMSYTYANVRVKQEIARLGILPWPEFWARTTNRGEPGPALLLTFTFTTIMIIAAPLDNANGYLVISTLFTYARTFVGLLLGFGLLAAPWLKSFKYGSDPWRPHGSRLGLWTLIPLVLLYICGNFFVLVFSWWPSDVQKSLKTATTVLPSMTGPIIGTVFLIAGAVYWVWDLYILRWLGYTTEVLAETQEESELDVQMYFHRNINGFALRVYELMSVITKTMGKLFAWIGF